MLQTSLASARRHAAHPLPNPRVAQLARSAARQPAVTQIARCPARPARCEACLRGQLVCPPGEPPGEPPGPITLTCVPMVPRILRRPVLLRAVAWALAVTVTGGVTAGCAGFSKAFGKREAIVHFQQGTPTSVRLTVRAACSHIPQARPEPLPTDKRLSDFVNNVRYRIDKASDAELARLESCLSKFPSVRGVETPQDQNS